MTRSDEDRFWLLWNDPTVRKNDLAHNPNLTPEQFDLLMNDPAVIKNQLAYYYRFNREILPVGIFNWTTLGVA